MAAPERSGTRRDQPGIGFWGMPFEAADLIARSQSHQNVGKYFFQAAIAATHVAARCFAETEWSRISALYDVLYQRKPSPVVALNRAVALGMRDGPKAGLF